MTFLVKIFSMEYRNFKAAVFLLTYLKYVAEGQTGVFTNGQGVFNSSYATFNLRFNFTSNNSYTNRTYGHCGLGFLKSSSNIYTIGINCSECSNLCLPLFTTEPNCSQWSSWSVCSVTCGKGTKTRTKLCLGTNCTKITEFNTSDCDVGLSCSAWSDWSSWSNCSVNCGNGTQTRVRLCPGCTVKEEFNTTICSTDLQCQDEFMQASQRETLTDEAPNLTSGLIVLVSIACFLMGIIVASLVSIFYLKRKHQGCFSQNDMNVQVVPKKQAGPNVQSLTKKVTANKDSSEDDKNENKAVNTLYQSLDFDQLSQNQQIHDRYEPMPHFDHCRGGPIPDYQNRTVINNLNNKLAYNGNSMNITHDQPENVYEYARDDEDSRSVSRQLQARRIGHNGPPTPVGDKRSGIQREPYNTDDEYLALEPVDTVRSKLDKQFHESHKYFTLNTVGKASEVRNEHFDAEHDYFVLEPVVKDES